MSENKIKEELYNLVFESSTEGLIIVNTKGDIEIANAKASELFGYTHEELLKLNVSDLIPVDLRKNHSSHMESYVSKPKKRRMGENMNLLALKSDGTKFPVEISLNHGMVAGEFKVVALISDISKRVEAENELKKLKEDLEKKVEIRTRELQLANADVKKALEKEKELNALKSRFVSMASHEFRTPLSTILSSTTLAERYGSEAQKEKRERHFKKIKSSVYNLTAILNDFLSLDKIQEGKITMNINKFKVHELFDECCDDMQTYFKTNQKVNKIFSCDNVLIETDRNILKNCIINLLSNASKYSPENTTIVLSANCNENNTLEIAVKDEGMGIPEKEQKHLFERFFRASNAFNLQGTGLGLNIVKKYVELLGGTITFESTEGKGTSFYLTIPLKTPTKS